MRIKEGTRDTFVLSTGREVYANYHIIGISPELEISEGYDGEINPKGLYTGRGGEMEGVWSSDERLELADYMINLWTRYRETSVAQADPADHQSF